MKISSTLTALYSERDRYGNCYWALRWLDHETGHEVCATHVGGESNLYAILRQTEAAKTANDWDHSIHFECHSMPRRAFKQLTKDWPYAGCSPAEMYDWITTQLRNKVTA